MMEVTGWPQCRQKSPGDIWGSCLETGTAVGSPKPPNTTQKHRSKVYSFRATSVPGPSP